jgi:hypothetical protein
MYESRIIKNASRQGQVLVVTETQAQLTDSILDPQAIQLSLGQPTPNRRLVDLGRKLHRSIDTNDVLDEHADSLEVQVVFAEKREGLLVELMLDGDRCDLVDIEALDLLNVSHHFALVGPNGSKEEELLEVAVVAEGRWLEDDLLEELDELDRQVGRQKRLDSDRHVLRVLRLRDSRGNDLNTR